MWGAHIRCWAGNEVHLGFPTVSCVGVISLYYLVRTSRRLVSASSGVPERALHTQLTPRRHTRTRPATRCAKCDCHTVTACASSGARWWVTTGPRLPHHRTPAPGPRLRPRRERWCALQSTVLIYPLASTRQRLLHSCARRVEWGHGHAACMPLAAGRCVWVKFLPVLVLPH